MRREGNEEEFLLWSYDFPKGARCENRDWVCQTEAGVNHNPVEMRAMLNAAQGFIHDAVAEAQPLCQMPERERKAELPIQRGAVFPLNCCWSQPVAPFIQDCVCRHLGGLKSIVDAFAG